MILNKRSLIEEHLPTYKIKRKKYHLSGSYDGFKMVSQKFKDLYEISNWQGLIFYSIPKSKGFYLIECSQQIMLNEAKRPIEFEINAMSAVRIWEFMVVFLCILMPMCLQN